jgi:hypothetical protein
MLIKILFRPLYVLFTITTITMAFFIKINRFFSLSFLFLLFVNALFAQKNTPTVFVKYIREKITLDGALDEAIWQKAEKITNFRQHLPRDSVKSLNNTEIRMLYNDNMLYIGIKADAIGSKFVVNSLRRDFGGPTNDNVSLMFDTFNDGTNAFMFSTSAYGVQREALVSSGGSVREDFNPNWDIKWQSDATITIPWNLRFHLVRSNSRKVGKNGVFKPIVLICKATNTALGSPFLKTNCFRHWHLWAK